jgi:hypothetical protein
LLNFVVAGTATDSVLAAARAGADLVRADAADAMLNL